MPLFAIYKNSMHKGNVRADNGYEAIQAYIIASDLEMFLNDKDFVSEYSYTIARAGVHFIPHSVK